MTFYAQNIALLLYWTSKSPQVAGVYPLYTYTQGETAMGFDLKLDLHCYTDNQLVDLMNDIQSEKEKRRQDHAQNPNMALSDYEKCQALEGHMVTAIKAYRTRSGLDLRGAKDVLDAYCTVIRDKQAAW